MAIQMYNKEGVSIVVENQQVQHHLKMGWTFQPQQVEEKPKPAKAKKVQDKSTTKEEPAESTLVFEAEATAEVLNPNKEK